MRATLVRIEQTCSGCPSQWDAWDASGRRYYIRYRWGHLTVQREDPDGEMLFEWTNSGNSLDGFMSTEEMLARLRSCG